MSDQRNPPLCDQHPWYHIRHRCCCVFDYDSDKDEPLAECSYHTALRAERDEAVALLKKYRFAGDDYPRDGWPDINAFLAKLEGPK